LRAKESLLWPRLKANSRKRHLNSGMLCHLRMTIRRRRELRDSESPLLAVVMTWKNSRRGKNGSATQQAPEESLLTTVGPIAELERSEDY